MPIKALNYIRVGAAPNKTITYEPGSILDLGKEEENRLISLKVAEELPEVIKEIIPPSNGSDQPGEDDDDTIAPEEFERLHNLLDDAFNKDPLIDAALKAGVELSPEARKLKDTVIEEIILQGKEEEVLAMKEGE
ncbi:hypothetical protein CHH83_05890 [Bacillus sp. 7586-K]|nr:hypothetical protein CHH83_05890 [Bacillus sp. 7586-K]